MKWQLLRYSSLGRTVLPLCLFLLASLWASAQTETHDFITYDTTIAYTCFPDSVAPGCTGNKFTVRISRPRYYFTAGNADTASRPWILTMPGLGEVGTDTNYLHLYGPHYWIQHGWDGGVQLNNGKHYPILVTLIASSSTVPPAFVQAVMDTLIRRYHPRTGSLHMAGLSMGVQVLGQYIGYEATAGDEHNMANVRSFVDLEGEAPGDYHGHSPLTYPYFMGHWAKKYGGRFFGLEGSNDSRNIWQISENMKDSLAGSAYFAFQTYGGGIHCCWDSMYDPSVTNWRCVPTITNTHIPPAYYLHPNTMGTYTVDPVTGTNIFQWMLRQGDTTLIGTGSYIPPTVTAGPDKSVLLPTDSVVLTGSATGNGGATIHTLTWTTVSGPNSPTIVMSSSNQVATIHGLIQGTYVFSITATDSHGLITSDSATVTVNAAYIAPTVTAGSDKSVTLPIDSVVLTGSATGNGGATIHALTWTTVSGPNSPSIVMTSSNQVATIHGLIQGTYVFSITATDSHGLIKSDSATVTVNPAPTAAAPKLLVAPGEYQVFILDSSHHIYAVGTSLATLGTGGTGTPGTTIPLAVSSSLTFKSVSACLHGGAAIDSGGHVWSWGDNDQGQVGNGTVSSSQVLTPVQLTTDSAGNAFTGITALYAYYSANASEGWYAVKSDSTLWVWGQTLNGMRGNGTTGSTASSKPVQVPIPGSRKVVQVAAGDHLVVLCSDSTVWTCGGASGNVQNLGYAASGSSFLSLQQLTTLSGITKIAGGGPFNYALKSNGTLYGWGYYGYYMGGTGGTNTPLATPTDLTSRLSLSLPIKAIAVNMQCTHVILSDSSLWGWGDNAQGGIGNGQELDFSTTTTPYQWDYYPAELLQQSPVQVTSRKDFVAIFANYNFVMYNYAETAGGQLYSWGRNKGAVLGNGIVGCSSDVIGAYPNSWDVTTPALVTPLAITSTTVGACPYCVTHPTTSPCNTCSTGTALTPPVNTATAAGLQTNGTGHVVSSFQLYPSVVQDNELLHLSIASDNKGPLTIGIYDMNGRLIRTLQTEKHDSYFTQSLNIGHVSGGMYLVKAIINDKEQLSAKFIRR